MTKIRDVMAYLERFAPPALAESWDNVGLLVGDAARPVSRVMTALTVTAEVAAEAIDAGVELIVTHHPLPFRPLARITTESMTGALLWRLVGAQISIYSPHTAFDSATAGINQRLAEGVGLHKIEPLVPHELAGLGAGRMGSLAAPTMLATFVERVKQFLDIEHVQCVGASDRSIERVAVACGSAAEFYEQAVRAGCDAFVTGEARFHACVEAGASSAALVLVGHYASERFGVEHLAESLAREFPALEIWASRAERDPIRWL